MTRRGRHALGPGPPRRDAGFTLIEVMTVLLILGILLAIALPIYLNARERAMDRAAQTDLRNAAAGAKIWFSDDSSYTGFTPGLGGTAAAVQPGLVWAAPGDPGFSDDVVIVEADGHELLLVRRSDSGTYFCLADQPNVPGYSLGRAEAYAQVDSIPECVGGWSA